MAATCLLQEYMWIWNTKRHSEYFSYIVRQENWHLDDTVLKFSLFFYFNFFSWRSLEVKLKFWIQEYKNSGVQGNNERHIFTLKKRKSYCSYLPNDFCQEKKKKKIHTSSWETPTCIVYKDIYLFGLLYPPLHSCAGV